MKTLELKKFVCFLAYRKWGRGGGQVVNVSTVILVEMWSVD